MYSHTHCEPAVAKIIFTNFYCFILSLCQYLCPFFKIIFFLKLPKVSVSVSFELSSPLYTGRHLPGSDFISKNKHDSVVNVMNQEIGQVKLIGEKAKLEKKSQVELVSQLQESLRIANNYAMIYQREKEDGTGTLRCWRDRSPVLLWMGEAAWQGTGSVSEEVLQDFFSKFGRVRGMSQKVCNVFFAFYTILFSKVSAAVKGGMFQLLHGYCLFVGHSDMSQWVLDKRQTRRLSSTRPERSSS